MIDTENIGSLNIRELWNTFIVLLDSTDEEGKQYMSYFQQEYSQVKNGINVEFPIHYIIDKWYEEYPSSKRVKILGYGKFSLSNFKEEIEKRETIMRRIILENMNESSLTEPR